MKKIVISIILIIILVFIYMNIMIHNNNKYTKELIKDIKSNYKTKEKIINAYTYNNYILFTTKEQIYVLDYKYNLIIKEKIKEQENKMIIYKNNKLLYLKTTRKNNKLYYKYYDLENNLIKKVEMEI